MASAGPGLLWKVYSGYKNTTRQAASVFVLERAALERFDRQDKEAVWELMRRGVSQLTRLRHPQILTVHHPLEESRDCLAFATEPVFCSLANALGGHDNLPSPLPEQLRGFKMFEVELKYGLLQVKYCCSTAAVLAQYCCCRLRRAWGSCTGRPACCTATSAPSPSSSTRPAPGSSAASSTVWRPRGRRALSPSGQVKNEEEG